jgi:hypothetical protein
MKQVICGFLVLAALAYPGTTAWAQEKQKYLFKTPVGVSQYVQQHAIDVGDVPGHQVRIYEIHSTYPDEAPVYDGIKVKEVWTRSVSDYTDGSGKSFGYGVAVLENGDKIFSRTELTSPLLRAEQKQQGPIASRRLLVVQGSSRGFTAPSEA